MKDNKLFQRLAIFLALSTPFFAWAEPLVSAGEQAADLDLLIAAQKDASGKTSDFKKEYLSLIQKRKRTDEAERLRNGNPVLIGYGCESVDRAVKETQVLREVLSAFIAPPDSQGRYPIKAKAEVLLSAEKAEPLINLLQLYLKESLKQEHVKNGVKLSYSIDPKDRDRTQDLTMVVIMLKHRVGRRYRLLEHCGGNSPFLEETKSWGCGTKVLHTYGFVATILHEELCQ